MMTENEPCIKHDKWMPRCEYCRGAYDGGYMNYHSDNHNDTDVATEYHEFLELVENNEPHVVAQVLNNNYTANPELEELVAQWRDGDCGNGPGIVGDPAFWQGVDTAADELEWVIGDD